jgi:hypothetical protein
MSEVTEFIAAIVAIAKDPDAWEKRLGNVKDAGSKLAEARMAEKQAADKAKAAAADLETARYERGQAEHSKREKAGLEQSITRREGVVNQREIEVAAREAKLLNDTAARNVEIDRLEAAIAEREKAADKKLAEAKALMESYDAAKHEAALKLAS